MAGNTLTTAAVNAQIAQDAIQMIQFYQWLQQRYQVWNQNLSTAILEATPLSFSASDAAQIEAVIGDMNRLIDVFQGTDPGSFTNIFYDCSAVRGCN